ncbi:MAG: hypothetical protein J5I93_06465, partial [Pirellulaceae bacterium]|nr:hypothetical protein [Pirellulaceae bacterium]
GEYFVQVVRYYNDHITPYTLTVTPGTIIVPTTPYDPGDTFGTALPLGTLVSTAVSYQDMYGVRDTVDYYKFTIDQPREVRVDLTGRREGGYMRLIADLNGNGTLDGGEELRNAGTPGSGDANITQDLEAGEYFVQVVRYYNEHITPYTLTVTPGTVIEPTTPQDPGETLPTALPLGTLIATPVSYEDMYGVLDGLDYYRFTLDQPRAVSIDLTGRKEGGYMRLIADLDGNGMFDGGEELRNGGTSGAGDANITQDLEAGDYFVQVGYYYFGHITAYVLTVTPGAAIVPTTPYDPGETLATALPLGTLGGTPVSYQDMYGVFDTHDVYRFTLDQPRDVRFDLTARGEGGYMRLIADRNGNGQIDSGEQIGAQGTSGAGDVTWTEQLEAGEYFLVVGYYYFGHITSYLLTFTALT